MHPRLTQSPPPTPVAGIRDASSSPTDLCGAGDSHRAGGETTNPRQSPLRSTDGTSRRWEPPMTAPDDDPEVAGAEATTLERRPPAALELARHRGPSNTSAWFFVRHPRPAARCLNAAASAPVALPPAGVRCLPQLVASQCSRAHRFSTKRWGLGSGCRYLSRRVR